MSGTTHSDLPWVVCGVTRPNCCRCREQIISYMRGNRVPCVGRCQTAGGSAARGFSLTWRWCLGIPLSASLPRAKISARNTNPASFQLDLQVQARNNIFVVSSLTLCISIARSEHPCVHRHIDAPLRPALSVAFHHRWTGIAPAWMCGLPSARITLEMIIYKAKGNPDRPEKVVQIPFEGSDSPKILIRHKPFPVVRCPWHSTGSHPSSLPAPTFLRCEPQPLVRRRRRPRQPRLPHNTEASPLPCLNNMQPRRRRHIFSHPPLTTRQSQPSTTTRSRQLPESTSPTPLSPSTTSNNLLLGEHLDSLGICAFADPRQSGFPSSRRRPRCPRRRRIKTRNFPRVQAPDGGGNKSTSLTDFRSTITNTRPR